MRTSQIPVILGGYDSQRQSFINVVKAAAGRAPVACWFPHRNDTTTSVDPISGRVWTADATMAGQISPLGKGSARAFDGATNYLATPDTNDLSFGNGTTDNAGGFGIFVICNVTDTAGGRTTLSKWTTALGREYVGPQVLGTDLVRAVLGDESVPATPVLTTNAVITQGVVTSLASLYTAATGGATAANDMSIYQNGAVVASTVANAATYVAMENGTSEMCIGAYEAHTTVFFQGTIGLVLVWASATATQVLSLHNASRSLFQF